MSFDLAVWHSDFPMTDDDAGAFYRHISRDWLIVREHPAIRAFCRDLMAEIPGVLDPADLETDFLATPKMHLMTYGDLTARPSPPFPTAPGPVLEEPPPWRLIPSFQGLAMTMSLGPGKREVGPTIGRLAGIHGLIAYNPQTGKVSIPTQLAGRPCRPLPEPVRLTIEEEHDHLGIRISFEHTLLFEGPASSRAEAHELARRHTIERDRLVYAVEDKRSLASAFNQPRQPTPPGHPILDLLKQMPTAPLMPEDEC